MQRPSGYTLLELMVTTAVLGVVLAIAVPSFTAIRRHSAISAAFHELTSSMATARLLAVTRGVPVTVCPSQDGLHCRRDRVWEQGWIVFLDPDRNENPLKSDDVIQHHAPSGRLLAIRSTIGRHWLRYHPSGMSPGTNQSLWICTLTDQRQVGRIVVNNGGRGRAERDGDPGTPCPFP